MLTLTAPSFGRTHHVVKAGRPPRRCGCGNTHDPASEASLRGLPLDPDDYDYAGAVLWNHNVGRLWNNLLRELRRACPGLSYALVREWQARGSLHLHVLLRMPASGYLPPRHLETAAARVTASADGVVLRFGAQSRAEALTPDGTAARTVWYLTKALGYLVKDVADGGGPASGHGRPHWARLRAAAQAFRCEKCAPDSAYPCGAPCHRRWGATSRVVTVSDGRGRGTNARPRWSISGLTVRSQRQARADWAAANLDGTNAATRHLSWFAAAVQARLYLETVDRDAAITETPTMARLASRLARLRTAS